MQWAFRLVAALALVGLVVALLSVGGLPFAGGRAASVATGDEP